MGNLIKINNYGLQEKEINRQRVVTFKDIDALHERVEGTARRNFNENKLNKDGSDRFIEGIDYFVRNSYEAKNEFDVTAPNGLTLITESGYLMLVKSLTDDLAWKVQRELVNNYFRSKESKPQCIEDVLIASLNEMKEVKQQIAAVRQENEKTQEELQGMRDVITLNPNSWKAEINSILSKIAIERGGTTEAYREVRNESYKLLDQRAGSKLDIRLTNRRRKVLEETGSKSKADKVSKVDVIADDKRLTEVYIAIVKEMAIKYKVA